MLRTATLRTGDKCCTDSECINRSYNVIDYWTRNENVAGAPVNNLVTKIQSGGKTDITGNAMAFN